MYTVTDTVATWLHAFLILLCLGLSILASCAVYALGREGWYRLQHLLRLIHRDPPE